MKLYAHFLCFEHNWLVKSMNIFIITIRYYFLHCQAVYYDNVRLISCKHFVDNSLIFFTCLIFCVPIYNSFQTPQQSWKTHLNAIVHVIEVSGFLWVPFPWSLAFWSLPFSLSSLACCLSLSTAVSWDSLPSLLCWVSISLHTFSSLVVFLLWWGKPSTNFIGKGKVQVHFWNFVRLYLILKLH